MSKLCPDCGERPVFERWERHVFEHDDGTEEEVEVLVDAPRCRPCHGARLGDQLRSVLEDSPL